MAILYLLFSFLCFDLNSAEPLGTPVDIHPLLHEISVEVPQVEVTLKFDGDKIPLELAHLLKFLQTNGTICEVKHEDPNVVRDVWGAIKDPTDNFSYLYSKKEGIKPFRLLSLDGGGIRGFLTCIFLSHLTHITGKPVHELFEMIVATSTGTLIAAGLGTKKPENSDIKIPESDLLPYKDSIPSPYYTPEELAGLYLKDGENIFSGQSWFSSWNGPKYSDFGLTKVLQKYFSDSLLADLAIPVVLTAYNLHKRTLEPFVSFDNCCSYKHIFVREAIRACVAAPTFFTPTMVDKEIVGDGGIVKNNPSSLGIAWAAKHFKADPTSMTVLSLGCGHCVDLKPLSDYQAMGIKGWAGDLLSGLFDGQVDHQIIQELHESGVGPSHYLRVTPLMDAKYMETDVTTGSNFRGLSEAGVSEILRRRVDFLRLAKVLTGQIPLDIRPDMRKIRAIPMSLPAPDLLSTDSAPALPIIKPLIGESIVVSSLITRSVSLPSLSDVDLLQSPQTGLVVLDVGSIPPAPALDQPMK